MKKILGIVALTLIAGAPVFAQDTTAIGYTLQVGGSNAGGATAKFDTTGVVQAGETPIYVAPDIMTWSVVVNASGSIVVDGNPYYISGAANLVWDLVLKGPNGQPVGPAFGLGSPTVPGFFSTIMNGTGLYAQQPASFSWEYGPGAPYGRLMDVDTSAGANMLQYTFPSTYSYYNNNNGTVYTTTAQVLAGTGTLMGMGAGYTDLDPGSTGVEQLGVGIVTDPGSVYGGCNVDIGAKAPIAEGQINMTGLPGGTYTLELIPGTGNNVAWSTLIMCGGFGNTGAFAVPAATTTGSTIQFVHEGAIEGTLAVTITPPGIGGQFSVDGGTTWNDAGSIQLAAGSYTVTAKPVAGYYTPAPQNVVIAAGSPTNVTLTYVQVEAPVLLAGTASVKLQGGVAYAIPFIGETVVNPGGSTSVSVECRAGGVTQIVLPFDAPVTAVDGTINAGAEVVVTGGTITTLDLSVAGQIKVNMTTTNQNGSCVTVAVSNIAKVTGGMGLTASKSIVALRGDVTANGAVDIGDINAVRAASGQPLNASAVMFRRDLTANGAIDIGDINNVRALSGNGFAGTCP